MSDSASGPARLLAQARAQVRAYLGLHADEAPGLSGLVEQLAAGGELFARGNMRGHITTSALVYDERADRVLMIHHRVLGRWLQPGGHHEGLEPLEASAAREVAEETGVHDLSAWRCGPEPAAPFDIDSHAIPANPAKAEAGHVHHDFIYLFRADSRAALRPQLAEVSGARWMPRAEFAALPEPRFARLDGKLQALLARRADPAC